MSKPSCQQEGHENAARNHASSALPLSSQAYLSPNWKARSMELSPGHYGTTISHGTSSGLPLTLDDSTTGIMSSTTLPCNQNQSGPSISFLSPPPATGTPTSVSTPALTSSSDPTSVSGSRSIQTASNSASKFRKAGAAAWGRLEKALHGLESTASLFPPLKSAIDGVTECLDVLKTAAQSEDHTQLEQEIQSMVGILDGYLQDLKLTDNVLLEDISESVKAKIENIDKMRGSGKGTRRLESVKYEQDLVKCSLYIKTLIQQLQNRTIRSTLHSMNKQNMLQLLRILSPAHDAQFNSDFSTIIRRRGCTAQTREEVQRNLHDWALDCDTTKFYWMSGMAGTGKTTIAYSLCGWLKDNGLLAASFFCSSASQYCRDIGKIIPTIAYQLAQTWLGFRLELCRVLEDEPDIATNDIRRQFEQLLERPLMAIQDAVSRNTIVVIDALDECLNDRGGRPRIRELFDILLKSTTYLPLKFFMTSRPDPALHDHILSRQSVPARPIPTIHLQDIELSSVEADITKYLTEAFKNISSPPTPSQIKLLAKRAGKLFVYAATVVHFVLPEITCGNASMRLESILSIPEVDGESCLKYEELDRLYTKIISIAFEGLLKVEKVVRETVLRTSICAGECKDYGTNATLYVCSCKHSPLDPLISAMVYCM